MKRPNIDGFRVEFDEDGGLGGGTDAAENHEHYSPGESGGVETQEKREESPASSVPSVDPGEIGKAVAENLAPHLAPKPEPLSTEELQKQLGYYRVDENTVNALIGEESTPEQRMAALQAVADGAYGYAGRTAYQMVQLAMQELRDELQPLKQSSQQQSESNFYSGLYSEVPQLKAHDNLVKMVVQNMNAAGRSQFASAADAYKAIAAETEKLGKQFNPNFTLAQQQQNNNNQAPANIAMGDAGGGVQSPSNNNAVPAYKKLFGSK